MIDDDDDDISDSILGHCAACLTFIGDIVNREEVRCPKCGKEIFDKEDWLTHSEWANKVSETEREWSNARRDGLIR